MKKIVTTTLAAFGMAFVFVGCEKSVSISEEATSSTAINAEEKLLVKAAGFNANWAEKQSDGSFLIEGDILLSKSQLEELAGTPGAFNLIIANEEHYRTTNVVNTGGGVRDITVSLGTGFPAHYSTGLDQALARYNALNLNIHFTRVATNGEIKITGAKLGMTIGGGCILGQSAGFPTNNGNPAGGFKLSTTKCATQYLNTADKADEVMAHEIGHCIGFRHTDYMNRASCGQNSNEGDAGVGAINIPGTPTTVNGSYNSWMMACTNGNPSFSSVDGTALQYVY